MTNYYQVLGVDSSASQEEIKNQFINLVKLWHPDKHYDTNAKKNAEEKFKQINEANSILSDPIKRSKYDLKIGINGNQKANTKKPKHDTYVHPKDNTANYTYVYEKSKTTTGYAPHTIKSKIESVQLEGTEVKEEQYFGASNIKKFHLSQNIKSINRDAFAWCTSVSSFIIPNSVESMGEGAFRCCTNLKEINIPNCIKVISADLFRGCSNLKKISIPKSVEIIDNSAFIFCSGLSEISFTEGLLKINRHAFRDCKQLVSLKFPNSLIEIGKEAFIGCENLEQIVFPNSSIKIGYNAFDGCQKIKWQKVFENSPS